MFNKEATQWPSYVENKRSIPTSIAPYKECMIGRREMLNAQERDSGLRINEVGNKISA